MLGLETLWVVNKSDIDRGMRVREVSALWSRRDG